MPHVDRIFPPSERKVSGKLQRDLFIILENRNKFMELKEFVKNVLKDLVEAVEESRVGSARDMHLGSGKENRTVEFDIAVTVEDGTASSGKAGIKVFQIIEGGGEVSKEYKNSSVSRVKFGVEISSTTKAEDAQMDAQFEQNRERSSI